MNIQAASAFTPNTPGAFVGVPMEVYLDAPGLSVSALKLLRRSPLDYRRKLDGLLVESKTAAMESGTVYHSAILEGRMDGFHVRPDDYVNGDGEKKPWSGNSKVCQAWLADHADKPVLRAEEARQVADSISYVRSHKLASVLLSGGYAEVSIFADVDGRFCKGRVDYLQNHLIDQAVWAAIDLKTTTDGTTTEFGKEILNREYHAQAAHYLRILKALGCEARWYFIALEKGQLPKINVRVLSRPALILGRKWLDGAMQLLLQSETDGLWPEWGDWDGSEGVPEIDLPAYAYADNEPLELTMGGVAV